MYVEQQRKGADEPVKVRNKHESEKIEQQIDDYEEKGELRVNAEKVQRKAALNI